MHITIIAIGTRGDVQPLVALAKGLHHAGYTIRVATNLEFETLVKEQGLDFFPLSGSPSQMMKTPDMQAAMGGNRNPFTLICGIFNIIKSQFRQGLAEIYHACQDTQALIPSMLGFYLGCHIAEKFDIPLIEGYALPGRPTRAFPSPVLSANLRLGGTANWLSHTLLLHTAWQLFQPVTNRARQDVLHLPPRSYHRLFHTLHRKQQPILYGYSPLILPKPPDWPSWHHVTGYWFLDRPKNWQPPADLANFLNAGPPPVYIGFGSITGENPEHTTQTVIQALQRTGQRGLLLTGWGGIRPTNLPGNIFKIASAPHDWLFPQMAAVVHHGGSGTTAAGLRAGIPSIIVPFGGDQFLWGRQIHALGVGPKPIYRRKLTVHRLAAAIHTATSDLTMQQKAAALGEKIRTENGVQRAVAIIQQTLGPPTP